MTLLERDREREALPVLGIPIVLVLVGQDEGVAVLVQDGQHLDRLDVTAEAGCHRQGDRHHLLRDVQLAVEHLVADQRDTSDLLQTDIQTFLAVAAEPFAVDQRNGAGDREEANSQLGFLERPSLLGNCL